MQTCFTVGLVKSNYEILFISVSCQKILKQSKIIHTKIKVQTPVTLQMLSNSSNIILLRRVDTQKNTFHIILEFIPCFIEYIK